MFDGFGNEALEKDIEALESEVAKIVKAYEGLVSFMLDLKELKNPEVDKLFEKYQVEVKR